MASALFCETQEQVIILLSKLVGVFWIIFENIYNYYEY
jgi:hypothetical protein